MNRFYDNSKGFSDLKLEAGILYGRLDGGDYTAISIKGDNGADGVNGVNAYLYVAYAADEQGTAFSMSPATNLNYIALVQSAISVANPTSSMFAGKWQKYIGSNGANGIDGADGVNAYTYVAYASDASGTAFSMSPADGLKYRAEIHPTTPVSNPNLADFSGAVWVKYIGDDGEDGQGAVSSVNTKTGAVTLTASDVGAATASHVHDGVYAVVAHNHNSSYAALEHTHSNYSLTTHDHAEIYAIIAHNHDSDYAAITHSHSNYSLTSHDHSGVYALASHAHSEYAASSHNHDSSYSVIGHSHSNYSLVGHNHGADYAALEHSHSNYSLTSHSHDTAYAPLTHVSDTNKHLSETDRTNLSSAAESAHYHSNKSLLDSLTKNPGGISSEFTINAVAHGFTSGSIGKLIFKKEDGTYILGIATALDYCALFIGELVAIPSADTLTCTKGRVTKTAHGYTGQSLCLSATTAGTMQSTIPDYGFVKAVANIIDANTLEYIDSPAIAISNMTIRTPSNENLLVNGDFQIAQEGTSFIAIPSSIYPCDNWRYAASTGAVINTAVSGGQFLDTYAKYLSAIVTTASTPSAAQYSLFVLAIEGLDFIKLWRRQTTLSFKIYSPITGIMSIGINNETQTRSFVAEVSLVPGWNNCSILVPLTSVDGTWSLGTTRGCEIYFILQCGVGSSYRTSTLNTWQAAYVFAGANQSNFLGTIGNEVRIADVKWEVGVEQTDFVPRDYEIELRKCRRYYRRLGFTAAGLYRAAYTPSGSAKVLHVQYEPMRAAPIPTKVGTWSVSNCNQPLMGEAQPESLYIYAISTASAYGYFLCGSTSAGVTLNARL